MKNIAANAACRQFYEIDDACREIDRLRTINAELLAALQDTAGMFQHYLQSTDGDDDGELSYEHACAAIAKAQS